MDGNWKIKAMIMGGIIGAVSGVGAAYILVQRAEVENAQPRLSAGEGVTLGLGILGLLRLVANMGKEK
jgi:hypothetical protein